jgi:arylamine N-acetyltransferase
MLFITTEGGERRERSVARQEEYEDILRQDFGIVMK